MKEVKLNEICDLQNGYAFKSGDYVDQSNTLNCRMSNIRPDGRFDIDYNPKYLPDNYSEKYKNFLLKDGDVVIAMTDMANDPKILGVPTVVKTNGKKLLLNQRVGKLKILEESKVHFPYLQIALNRPHVKGYFKQFSGGGLQINIGKKEVLGVTIPLPPLAEQERIAAVLDEADGIRQRNRQLLTKYDQLAQSVFLEMFGDFSSFKKITYDSIADKSVKGTFSNGPFGSDLLTSELKKEGVPVIYIRDIRNGEFNWKSDVFVTKDKANSLKNCQVLGGDLLLAKVGDPPGIAAIYPNSSELAIITQDVIRLRVNTELVNPVYVKYWLNSKRGQHSLKPIIVEGTRKRFGLKDLKGEKLPIPPLTLQNRFAEIVGEIEQQKVRQQQELAKSEELFQSLLQRAFKGELFG